MQTPRQVILKNTSLAEAQRKMVVSPTFDASARMSLLQMFEEMPDTTDPVIAAAAYNRLIGARSYLRLLTTIAEPVTQNSSENIGNLNHRA